MVVLGLVVFVRSNELKNQKIELQNIKVKDTATELKSLEQRYDLVNKQLDQAKGDSAKVKQLEEQRQKDAQELQRLQKELQAKKQVQSLLANKNAVYAAPVPSGDTSSAKMFIYMHESGNRTNAINASSGACGLGQALPCSKMGCSLSDYACQDAFFTRYMQGRYGSWENARVFWLAHSWW